MSGLTGDLSSLKNFSAALGRLPRVVAQKVALAAAPALTDVARETFEAGENAYGLTWAPGSHGQHVTLRKSGTLSKGIHYVAIGTKLRVALATSYAKFQLGKRPVFPRQGAPLPTAYVEALKATTAKVIAEEMGAP